MITSFDPTRPIAHGITVLEASAGTGKTHALSSALLRLVAVDGIPIERIAVMTFTRNAARELRARIRSRLRDALDPRPSRDDLVTWLRSDDRADAALARVRSALRDFDRALVTTIHGFCGHCLDVLLGSGDAPLLDDESDLVAEVINDFYVKGFAAAGDELLAVMPGTWHVERIVRAALADPRARIVPAPSRHTREGLQAAFALRARERARQRRLAAGVRSFDDLQAGLAELLDSDAERVRAALSARFSVALVDELQDTDQQQWELLTSIFAGARLLAVGDGKQAIYGFRGGDVHTFVRALGEADDRAVLVTNRRSDPSYLAACDAVFGGQTFGDPSLTYQGAHAHHPADRWHGEPAAALEIRTLEPLGTRADGSVPAGIGRDLASRDAALVAARLLRSDARIVDDDGPRGVRPADLAVLVRTNAQAALMRRRLADAGVPAVVGWIGNVLHGHAAQEWLALLRALQRPSSSGLARRAALTPFVGWDGHHLATAGAEELWRLHDDLHTWSRLLTERGVPALVDRLAARGYAARLLALPDGARLLTDLEHVAELLQAAGGPSPTAALLQSWLERAVATARTPPAPEHQQRLESDADAVRITTIHGAKGLEFGVVLAPFLWTAAGVEWACARFHDAEGGLVLDVGCKDGPPDDGRRFRANRHRAQVEALAEECRLTYVAVTRARHRAVLWWAPTSDIVTLAGLTETLLRFAADDRVGRLPGAQLRDERLEELARRGAPHLEISQVTAVDEVPTGAARRDAATPTLRRAAVPATVPRDWMRASYSRLKSLHEPPDVEAGAMLDEPHPASLDEDRQPPPPRAPEVGEGLDREVRLSGVPGGAVFGTVVHAVLEHVDFAAGDLRERVAQQLEAQATRQLLPLDDPDRVVDALVAAVHTPVPLPRGGPTDRDHLRLADVPRGDRLDELGFELSVAGGSRSAPGRSVSLAAIADVVADHLPPDDPLGRWPERLRDELGEVAWRGYLAGFIDLVVRDGDRHLVVDHKTNTLGPPGQPLLYGHYTPARLAEAMVEEHYPLQALCYLVALHRHLRLTLGSVYDADRHLAGVAYLFLRGMGGADTPTTADGVCGVFAWRPPTALVTALDDLFARGRA